MSSRVPADIKRGRLSPSEEAQIVTLAERFNCGRIAQKLKRHPSTVNFAMHRLGLRATTPRQFSYRRNGVEVRSFSPAEDRRIEQLRVSGLTPAAIAEDLFAAFGYRRSGSSIRVRLLLLANMEERHARAG